MVSTIEKKVPKISKITSATDEAALYYQKNPTQRLLDNSDEGNMLSNLDVTPGFTKDGCLIQ